MADESAIEWTDATWNPVTGCTKISPGCANCYIDRTPPLRMAGRKFVRGDIPVILHPERLDAPLRWRKPRRVFVNSLSDLFHEDVPDDFILAVFSIMGAAKQHTFQVLTKRPARMADLLGRFTVGDYDNELPDAIDNARTPGSAEEVVHWCSSDVGVPTNQTNGRCPTSGLG